MNSCYQLVVKPRTFPPFFKLQIAYSKVVQKNLKREKINPLLFSLSPPGDKGNDNSIKMETLLWKVASTRRAGARDGENGYDTVDNVAR